ncbi:RNA-directed DNA polymerase (reversetranscriptase)-related family protein [Striga asiatica]|uniref:RNA-directed DNA polymerase (Reversetranscriptase)-related family protein n=1 Tax=Striga asiatica TaxID=4170 RepID=A0A5A7R1C3_STRAF|nr:RNA-directed DNA polymerase (reversetranscriptase)-related family protein [Striga asiatica]
MTKTLIKDHKPNLFALIEPKIALDSQYFCRLFNLHQVVQNTSNHIWLFCDHNCQIQILHSSRQLLHVKVSSPLSPTPFMLSIVYGEHTRTTSGRDLTGSFFLICGSPPSLPPPFRTSLVTSQTITLCSVNLNPLSAKLKPSFHFQNMWTRHYLFLQVVKDSWSIPSPSSGLNKLLHKLARLKRTLKAWNRNTFGNIFARVTLERFENVSGQKVSSHKSRFILHNPSPHLVERVHRLTGFTQANLPLQYLGAPLWKGNQNRDLYNDLLYKISSRISSWNHHILSIGGRLELIKSTLISIPFYCLQVLNPPRTLHRLCFPTEEGGFGCRNVQDLVRTTEVKLWWRLRSTSNIWTNLILSKYCPRLHPMEVKRNPADSPTWKRLCSIRTTVDPWIHWLTGDGNISFWHDRWCQYSPLSSLATHTRSNLLVREVWNGTGWNIPLLQTLLPSHVIDSITVFPTHLPSSPPIWKLSSNGSFSFKSAWQAIRTPRSPNPIFRHIWSSLFTPTISTFMVRLLSFWISTPDGLFGGESVLPSLASVVRIWNPSLTFSSSAQLPQQYGSISTLSPLSPKYPPTAFKPLSPTGSILGLASPIYSTSFPFLSFGTSSVPAMTKELNKSPSLLNASAIEFGNIFNSSPILPS